MNARISAEALYESEATLRMVDTALDELQSAELADEDAAAGEVTPATATGQMAIAGHVPDGLCVRSYWQIQEILEDVRRVKHIVASDDQTALPLERDAEADPVGSMEALLDTLEQLDGGDAEQRRNLIASVQAEVRSAREADAAAARAIPYPSPAESLVAEIEAKLTRLAHIFEDGDKVG